MIAFDTASLVDEHRVLSPKSVVLETEWMRARYGLTPAEIIEFLAFLLGSEGVVMEDEAAVLHLGSVGDTPLYTLDKAFCKRAIRKGLTPKVVLVRPGS